MHRIYRGLSLLLELRPPLGFCLVDQREVVSFPGEQLHPMLSSSWMIKVGELQVRVCVQDTKAGGFEGAGLQCTLRLSEWLEVLSCVCFLSFITFRSKKQLKPLETANLKGEKNPNPKIKIKGS